MVLPREARKLLALFAAVTLGLALIGVDRLVANWRRDIEKYVSDGGSLLRIVSGPPAPGRRTSARL